MLQRSNANAGLHSCDWCHRGLSASQLIAVRVKPIKTAPDVGVLHLCSGCVNKPDRTVWLSYRKVDE